MRRHASRSSYGFVRCFKRRGRWSGNSLPISPSAGRAQHSASVNACDVAVGHQMRQQPFHKGMRTPPMMSGPSTAKSVTSKPCPIRIMQLLLMGNVGGDKIPAAVNLRTRHFNIISTSFNQLRMKAAVLSSAGFVRDGRPSLNARVRQSTKQFAGKIAASAYAINRRDRRCGR